MTTFAILDLILWFKAIMENKDAPGENPSTS
jgi:hypothetical protein